MSVMPTIAERRQTFRELHRSGCFAIPNPWDIGSARYLQHLGFEAIGDSGTLLVARAECFLVGVTNIDEVIRRLTAYADADADCLYAPGIRDRDHIAAVVAAVAPKPVNLLIGGAVGLTMSDAAALGVRRVSVGGALARASWGGLIRAAKELAEHGTFDGFAGATPHAELQEFFRDDAKRRHKG